MTSRIKLPLHITLPGMDVVLTDKFFGGMLVRRLKDVTEIADTFGGSTCVEALKSAMTDLRLGLRELMQAQKESGMTGKEISIRALAERCGFAY